MKSHLEEHFAYHLRVLGMPEPVREFMFAKSIGRRWRVDFAWPDKMVLVEIEGGIWIKGRHTRGQGFENDCRKYNAAAEMGYRVFRFTSNMLQSGEAANTIERIIKDGP